MERRARERAMLIGIRGGLPSENDRDSLAELGRLANTAGAQVVTTENVNLRRHDAATLVSNDRVERLAATSEESAADLVIFDTGLSPTQQRNLEEGLKRKVLDRQQLILDIFASRARTSEGKVQVELAQLKYTLPRLRGMWRHLERQAGGIGTRGPGEKQIESDKRKIITRIAHLEEQIRRIKAQRTTQRRRRQRQHIPMVALVGYTNAGKSTLLNALAGSAVHAEDKLFATLDPTTRSLQLPGGTFCTMTDTVGFINKLPATLAAAFRATLEEICYADVLIHVVDATSGNMERDLATTREALENLGAHRKEVITVWNKCDALEDPIMARSLELRHTPSVAISATTGEGLDRLREMIEEMLATRKHEATLLLGYGEQALLARLHQEARVDSVEYVEGGILVHCGMPEWLLREVGGHVVEDHDDPAPDAPDEHGGEASGHTATA